MAGATFFRVDDLEADALDRMGPVTLDTALRARGPMPALLEVFR